MTQTEKQEQDDISESISKRHRMVAKRVSELQAVASNCPRCQGGDGVTCKGCQLDDLLADCERYEQRLNQVYFNSFKEI